MIRIVVGPSGTMPSRGSAGAAGWDLHACCDGVVLGGQWLTVGTDVSVSVPAGHVLDIRPRSGLAAEFGVTVLNSPGTIDSDYRGELKVILINFDGTPFEFKAGDRIAQMVLLPLAKDQTLRKVSGFGSTGRGDGGLGSTGR